MEDIIKSFTETGQLLAFAPEDLRPSLVGFGANMEDNYLVKGSLANYSNKGKSNGMRFVWGEAFSDFKKWTKVYIEEYETQTGVTLPALEGGFKGSGLIAWFGEWTAYAYGAMSWVDFKLYQETRWHNGKLWEEGRKSDRIRIQVPTSDKPKRISSFPPEYPEKGWSELKAITR